MYIYFEYTSATQSTIKHRKTKLTRFSKQLRKRERSADCRKQTSIQRRIQNCVEAQFLADTAPVAKGYSGQMGKVDKMRMTLLVDHIIMHSHYKHKQKSLPAGINAVGLLIQDCVSPLPDSLVGSCTPLDQSLSWLGAQGVMRDSPPSFWLQPV